MQTLARMADLFGIQMGEFAAVGTQRSRIMRVKDRPRTVLAAGVNWLELASPGHALEPAILMVPPGIGNGGLVVRAGEIFILVQLGELTIQLQNPPESVTLKSGDSIILDAGTPHSWCNLGWHPAACLGVEQIGTLAKQTVVKAQSAIGRGCVL